jgi:hypothetical protein
MQNIDVSAQVPAEGKAQLHDRPHILGASERDKHAPNGHFILLSVNISRRLGLRNGRKISFIN